eukprot:1286539-Ditylum_brightwellii.AAC.1
MSFNASKLVDMVCWEEVDTLADIVEIIKSSYRDEQKVDFVYFILQQLLNFKLDLKAWNSKALSDNI